MKLEGGGSLKREDEEKICSLETDDFHRMTRRLGAHVRSSKTERVSPGSPALPASESSSLSVNTSPSDPVVFNMQVAPGSVPLITPAEHAKPGFCFSLPALETAAGWAEGQECRLSSLQGLNALSF